MKLKFLFFILLIVHVNLYSADFERTTSVLSELTWATTTSAQTLKMMAHSGLNRLVPRGALMTTYGLPVVCGTCILLGSFDTRNHQSLSGNLVNSPGAILDLVRLMGMCGIACSRDDVVENLHKELTKIECTEEVKLHHLVLATELLRMYKKLAPQHARNSYPKIERMLDGVLLDIPTPEGVRWNADEFFGEPATDYPVIFASTTIFAELKPATGSGCTYEFLAEKELVLGVNNDIQFVFVYYDNIAQTQALLDRIIPNRNNQPRLIALEHVQRELFSQILRVRDRVGDTWSNFFDQTAIMEHVKSNPGSFEFLPAFIDEKQPVQLGCTLAQLPAVLATLKEIDLKPLSLFSPVIPSCPSFILRSPEHAHAPAEKIEEEITTWMHKLKAGIDGIVFSNGSAASFENTVIAIELGW